MKGLSEPEERVLRMIVKGESVVFDAGQAEVAQALALRGLAREERWNEGWMAWYPTPRGKFLLGIVERLKGLV